MYLVQKHLIRFFSTSDKQVCLAGQYECYEFNLGRQLGKIILCVLGWWTCRSLEWRQGSDWLGQLLRKMKIRGGGGRMFPQRRVSVETTCPFSGNLQRTRGDHKKIKMLI